MRYRHNDDFYCIVHKKSVLTCRERWEGKKKKKQEATLFKMTFGQARARTEVNQEATDPD